MRDFLFRRVLGWHGPERVRGDVDIPLRSLRRALPVVMVALVPLNLVVGYLKWKDYEEDESPLDFFLYFDVGAEQNLPTWIATILLITAAYSAGMASQRRDNPPLIRHGFRVTAALLAYASLDEATYLHERTTDPLRENLGLGGPFYWAWVVPGIVVVGVATWKLWPFVRDLPGGTRSGLILSAALFVGSALGLEMLGGLLFDLNGEEANVLTELLNLIEEFGEMLGVLVFIETALRYAVGADELVDVTVADTPSAATS